MKISITDKGSGIAREFGKAISANVVDRFVYIPESKGAGYLTGFSWGSNLITGTYVNLKNGTKKSLPLLVINFLMKIAGSTLYIYI